MWGSPALPFGDAKRVFAATRRTPEMLKEIAGLKRQLEELSARLTALQAAVPGGSAADREPQRKP
jgi:hypothetical protein